MTPCVITNRKPVVTQFLKFLSVAVLPLFVPLLEIAKIKKKLFWRKLLSPFKLRDLRRSISAQKIRLLYLKAQGGDGANMELLTFEWRKRMSDRPKILNQEAVSEQARRLCDNCLLVQGYNEVALAISACVSDVKLHKSESAMRCDMTAKGIEVPKRWQVAPGVFEKTTARMMKLLEKKEKFKAFLLDALKERNRRRAEKASPENNVEVLNRLVEAMGIDRAALHDEFCAWVLKTYVRLPSDEK